jgi:hypothetical protein
MSEIILSNDPEWLKRLVVLEDGGVPSGEIQLRDKDGKLVGKIENVGE